MVDVAGQNRAGLYVSRETVDRLEAFLELVQKWTNHINLVSAADAQQMWNRHILDSMQLYPMAPEKWEHWVDMGSGGGFPGIVIAILARQNEPAQRITLVESDQRKATFLRTAIRELSLSGSVFSDRAEAIPPLQADVLSARAFGPLTTLLPLALRHLGPSGRALFPKGRTFAQEIKDANKDWTFELVTRPSITDPDSQILQIERIGRA